MSSIKDCLRRISEKLNLPQQKEQTFGFKAEPRDDLKVYLGKRVIIRGVNNNQPLLIESISICHFKPAFYEINGRHLIGVLRFYAQMNNDKSITEQQFRDFEAMETEAEKLPPEAIGH